MKIIYSFAAVLLVCFALSSCAKKMTFVNSPVVPAATGKVKYKKDDNNNYIISVEVENLAAAKNLTPPRELYVVWMESKRNRTRNIGQINTSSGLFSSKLKGSLKAVSTTTPTSFFITAEDNGNVQYPGSQRVLSTE